MSMPRTAPDHTERQAHSSQPAYRPERHNSPGLTPRLIVLVAAIPQDAAAQVLK
jgi:hypothetical protein